MPQNGLDALTAAPLHHTLLFENDSVRVLEVTVGPGETVPLHTHNWPSLLYILGWSDTLRRDAAGEIVLDGQGPRDAAPGTALWSPPLAPHTLENVGGSELRVVCVELKLEGASGTPPLPLPRFFF